MCAVFWPRVLKPKATVQAQTPTPLHASSPAPLPAANAANTKLALQGVLSPVRGLCARICASSDTEKVRKA